ncbi:MULTISPECIES: class I SAM-dependent methyltransferase [unclassified Fusibacter]|uniref:class I SAM-dependent methyltransferase n=1 Tax=unclassified Fusibacter TaxID=2624464 RepID=UPI0013E933AB|nr:MULTISPECIES: class I SAM-dependent methyltransferase [unclassified Fusibacter]MCK8060292.1 methyltransferase domain-containing protein [Fusibacter sp. A2]NPE20419.1 methyltransferase domain-containing protein [Fusibacter sp. A1]
MKHTFWSNQVQTADLLYQTRNIRFRHAYKVKLLKGIGAKGGTDILEIGCGPGSLSFRIKEWLPDARVTALDRDSNFVEYVKQKSLERNLEITAVEGDALKLPFKDETFDLTTSHTVIEHVPTKEFFDEQYRVLKNGGTLSVISSRPELAIHRNDEDETTSEEKDIWELIRKQKGGKLAGVCEYPLGITEIPKWFEKTGFRNIEVDFEVITYIPDDHRSNEEHKIDIVEIERNCVLDCIRIDEKLLEGKIESEKFERLVSLVNTRYDNLLKRTLEGGSTWQTAANLLMMVRGIK